MICFDRLPLLKTNNPAPYRRVLCGMLVLVAAVGLTACGSKEKKAGQALARVNGEEITILQVNDELSHGGVQPDQQEAAAKQVLEKLIDRQLILAEAMRVKIDRTPEVMKAIERAKTQIIVQAYLKSATSKTSKPSQVEIDDYFQNHPEYFTNRKQFDMKQLVLATSDLDNKLMPVIDSAKSLDEVAAWMDAHNISYQRGQLSRSTADVPPEMATKLLALPQGQMFIVREGANSLINTIIDIKESPVPAKIAAPQIAQYLINKKANEIAGAEITHLRSSAKIEYLNAPAASKDKPAAQAPETKGAATEHAGSK